MKTLARPRDQAEVMERLRRLRSDSARRWGRMTPHQMVCHLCDGFLMAFGEKTVSAVHVPVLTTLLRWGALYTPVPWPAGIPTRPEVDQERGGTKPVEFAADLRRLETLVERASSTWPGAANVVHPILGRMSERAWRRWAWLHLDHHLRQFGA